MKYKRKTVCLHMAEPEQTVMGMTECMCTCVV